LRFLSEKRIVGGHKEGLPMRSFPAEFRYRVIALADEGMSSIEIAEVLGASASWVDSIKRLHASGQPLEPKSRANKRKSLAQREGDRIRARVAEHPGTTLEDLKRDLGLTDTLSNIWYALQTLGLSLKKKNAPCQRTRPARCCPTTGCVERCPNGD
jgi:transposase